MQGVFWLRFPCGKLGILIHTGVYWLEEHLVSKSITRWNVLLNTYKHVNVHNSLRKPFYPAAILKLLCLQTAFRSLLLLFRLDSSVTENCAG